MSREQQLSFVTSNASKLAEVAAFFAGAEIRVTPVIRRLPEVQADDLGPVVEAKLRATEDIPGTVLVEDSGLFVDSLGGFPGLYSSYVYRTIGLSGLLRLLEGRPRGAEFRTVAGLRRQGVAQLLKGSVRGSIAERERGSHGFAYDPVFIPEGEERTFAEMRPSEKLVCSHRGRALAQVLQALRTEPSGSC